MEFVSLPDAIVGLFYFTRNCTINKATILIILIIGLMAGPAVSL